MEHVLHQMDWNLAYARALVADVPDTLWGRPGPKGLENHPAWTLGHIVTGLGFVAAELGLERDLPDGWRDLFERNGPGDPRVPDPDPAKYPTAAALLKEMERQQARLAEAIRGLSAEALEAPVEWRFDGALPTMADYLVFLLVAHANMHLGQLASWRRHHDLPSALAGMAR